MALSVWQRTIVDERGNVQPGAVLQVTVEETDAVAAVYRDRDGADPYPPGAVTADEFGLARFYAEPGRYRIRSITPAVDWRNVEIGSAIIGIGPDEVPTNAIMEAAIAVALDQAEEYIGNEPDATLRSIRERLRDFVLITDYIEPGDPNDGPALTRALVAGDVVIMPWRDAGYDLGDSTFIVGAGKWVVGQNQVLVKSTSDTDLFLCQGYDKRSGISDLTIDMAGCGPASVAIRLDTSYTVVWGARFTKLRFQNCVGAIVDDAGGTYITDIEISDIQCRLARGPQIMSRKSRGSFLLRDVFVDNTVGIYQDPIVAPLVTWKSIFLEDFIGIELERVDVVGQSFLGPGGDGSGTAGYYLAGADGIHIKGGPSPADRHVWLTRVRAEACLGHGILLEDITFLEGTYVEAFSNRGLAVYLEGVSEARLFSLYGRGANDQVTIVPGEDPFLAGAPAVGFVDCFDIDVAICGGSVASGHGILINNSTRINITQVRAELNTGSAIVEQGTSDRNTITGYEARDNGGGIALAGPRSRASNGMIADVRMPDVASTFSAHKNGAAQSIPSATFTKVTFGTELVDSDGRYDASTSRWTPPSGIVDIRATVQVSSGVVAGASLAIQIYKNGGIAANRFYIAASTAAITLEAAATIEADGDDYFEVYVYLEGAGDKSINGAASYSQFSGRLL